MRKNRRRETPLDVLNRVRTVEGFRREIAPSFLRRGRRTYTIYCVSLLEHEGVVKIGRTTNWNNRIRAYQTWNLSQDDAIADARTFTITDEYVDLERLEADILAYVPFERRHGREWFSAEFEEVCRSVGEFLDRAGVGYF